VVSYLCTLRFMPGHYEQAVRTYKNPKVPAGIKVLQFWGMFGENDALLIFEAAEESAAAEFVVQFREHSHTSTSVIFPVADYKWTR
jgi:uncharacterized protein with GYD domain